MWCIPALHYTRCSLSNCEESFSEVYQVLKPGRVFTLVNFHAPTNPIFLTGILVFLLLFETETAWQLSKTDLPRLLTETGFEVGEPTLYTGSSLQVVQAKK
jgi:hypothetical protein